MAGLDRLRPESCLSDLMLDELTLGDRPCTGAVAEHLSSCLVCRSRLQSLHEAQAQPVPPMSPALAAAWSASASAHKARPIAGRVAQPLRRWRHLAATLAVAAYLVMFWRLPAPPSVRLKGALGLELLARHRDGSVSSVLPGEPLAPGEAVRFRLSSAQSGYLIVLGLDSTGQVTPYAPSGAEALPFAAGPPRLLDGSVILDDSAGAERIVALSCARPTPVAMALTAGRRALAQAHGDPRAVVGDLGLGCAHASTWFGKTAR